MYFLYQEKLKIGEVNRKKILITKKRNYEKLGTNK